MSLERQYTDHLGIDRETHSLSSLARLFRLKEGEGNNNPPAGDLRCVLRVTPAVDPNMGGKITIPLVLLVVFPPVTEIPVLQRQAQFFAAA